MANRADNFNRADSAVTLGTPSDAGSDWVAYQGAWGISSNRGYPVGGADGDTAALEAGVADVEVQVTVQTRIGDPGIVARLADNANYLFVDVEGAGDVKLWKLVAAGYTLLGTYSVLGAFADGDILKLRCSGDTLEVYHNGTLVIGPVTESAGNANTKHGLTTYIGIGGLNYYEDFSIADLSLVAPGGSGNYYRRLLAGMRG